ncbi:hypothetical protein CGZ80_14680 [Rhodopirellula sp. MGV]|nr:hypothetical protein CGZ80_14680 [Rhodopirellula sp. MGV]PNY36907.1 hypothetical protein C2E31_10645 [Rhodopirellula baltica]
MTDAPSGQSKRASDEASEVLGPPDQATGAINRRFIAFLRFLLKIAGHSETMGEVRGFKQRRLTDRQQKWAARVG